MSIFNALPIILQNGTLADAAQVMADFNKIISDGNANAAANGANSDITSLSGLTSPIPPVGGSSSHFIGSGSTGTAAAQVVATVVPNNWSLTTGFMISFNPGFSSVVGGTTLAVNGGSALAIRKASAAGPLALAANDIVVNQNTTVIYDGTAYLLINEPNDPAFGALTNLASAATTDLGTIPSQNINITGTTTITSFGSSAAVANPFYLITFAGALLLTYNAASLIIPGSANLTTAAGDWCIIEYLGSGNWKIVSYSKANGQAVANPTGTTGVFIGVQAFTTTGTYTPSAGAATALVIMTGGGGGGGGGSGTSTGGSGAAGGTTWGFLGTLTTQTVTVGTGGTGGGGSTTGVAGGGSSLGGITANGGAGGGGGGGSAGANAGHTGRTGTGFLSVGGAGGGAALASGASFWALSNSGANQTDVGCGGGAGAVSTSGFNGAAGIVLVFEFK